MGGVGLVSLFSQLLRAICAVSFILHEVVLVLYFWRVNVFTGNVFSHRRFTGCSNDVIGQLLVAERPLGADVRDFSVEGDLPAMTCSGNFYRIFV